MLVFLFILMTILYAFTVNIPVKIITSASLNSSQASVRVNVAFLRVYDGKADIVQSGKVKKLVLRSSVNKGKDIRISTDTLDKDSIGYILQTAVSRATIVESVDISCNVGSSSDAFFVVMLSGVINVILTALRGVVTSRYNAQVLSCINPSFTTNAINLNAIINAKVSFGNVIYMGLKKSLTQMLYKKRHNKINQNTNNV